MFDLIRTICIYFVETLCIITYFDTILTRRMVYKWLYISVPIAASLMIIVSKRIPVASQFSNSLPMVFLILIAFILYKGNLLKKIFAVFLFYGYLCLMDLLVIFSMKMFFEGGNVWGMLDSPILGSFAVIASKIAASIGMLILQRCFQNKTGTSLSIKDWISLSIVPVTTLFMVYYLMGDAFEKNVITPFMTILVLFLMLLNIVVFSLFNRLLNESRIKNENQLFQQQIKLQTENFHAVSEAHQKLRRLAHDTNNCYLTLKGMIESHEYQAAEEMLIDLVKISNESILPVKTGHIAIDTILNQKYSSAQKEEIKMEFWFDKLTDLKIQDIDLVTVFANLLDNAIEACRKIENLKLRVIEVKVNQNENALFLSIRNRIENEVRIKNNTIATTKQDKEMHGIGLDSVKHILEKYKGEIYFLCKDNWFQVTLSIPEAFEIKDKVR